MLSIFKHDTSACRCNFWEVLYVTLESWARGRCYDGIWGEGCLRGTIACKGEPLRAGGEAGRSSAALLGGSRVTFPAELVHDGPRHPAQPPDEDSPRAAWPGAGTPVAKGQMGAGLPPPPTWLAEHCLLAGEGHGLLWDASCLPRRRRVLF